MANGAIVPVVYMVESPGEGDVRAGRCEGRALSEVLKLADIASCYYTADDLNRFQKCLAQVAADLYAAHHGDADQQDLYLPYLHLSAHGNEQGIALTSGEEIDWGELHGMLRQFAKESGARTNPLGVPLVRVSFSTCRGAFARTMFDAGEPYPCWSVLGAKTNVWWSDALTVYVSYYHNLLHKRRSVQESVTAMNQAAGLKHVFQCYVAGRPPLCYS